MKHKFASLFLLVGLLVTLPVLAACDGEPTETTGKPTPVPFSIDIFPVLMEDAIAEQSCVFLVTVSDEGSVEGESKPVYISATTTGGTVTVGPRAIAPGYVAEVVIIPDEASIGNTLTVTVEGERDGLKETETVTLAVREASPAVEGLAINAVKLLSKFIPWLAENYPDLNITDETKWAGTVVYPNAQDTIKYYLFFSEDWEVGIRWNVTTEADDWVKIYLRMRTAELTPSEAFEISSVAADEEPHTITPPKAVWR
ncbi:MAG: hypothetical protein MUO90_03275 [Dehalococcoidales bacterium]|nr:hypothetical protein [Dehalococcoidales bacterium]